MGTLKREVLELKERGQVNQGLILASGAVTSLLAVVTIGPRTRASLCYGLVAALCHCRLMIALVAPIVPRSSTCRHAPLLLMDVEKAPLDLPCDRLGEFLADGMLELTFPCPPPCSSAIIRWLGALSRAAASSCHSCGLADGVALEAGRSSCYGRFYLLVQYLTRLLLDNLLLLVQLVVCSVCSFGDRDR